LLHMLPLIQNGFSHKSIDKVRVSAWKIFCKHSNC